MSSLVETKLDCLDRRTLHVIREVARILSSSREGALSRALEVIAERYGASRSIVVIRRKGSSEIRTEAFGLNQEEQKAFLLVEDGLVHRVLATGKAAAMPRATDSSVFPNPEGVHAINRRSGKSFFCVPIGADGETAGALLVEMEHDRYRDYTLTLTFYEVVAFMMFQMLTIANLSQASKPSRSVTAVTAIQPARKAQCFEFANLVGNSGPMQQVYEQISRVAGSNATVMIRGESGTGKELIAHAIHHNSSRKNEPFIKVNCAALPETLIESELFGYERGAFTGAQTQKKGRFELAEGGTLFLDEIGELNAVTSVKLLRVLQEREFERVGGVRTVKANVRLIVATNKDLEEAISAGAFREDLFYRLNVFTILLPPLRDRKADVSPLADHFLQLFNRTHGKNVKCISPEAMNMLMGYSWPGNVRELSNIIERAVLICDDQVIYDYHLPEILQTTGPGGNPSNLSLRQCTENHEKNLIQDILKTTRGNRARAAKLLGTTERVISYKAVKYGIDCSQFK